MQTVRHHGVTVAIDHPALWIDKGDQILRDLVEVLNHPRITLACLRHLIANRERLIAGHYVVPDGRGCLMFVLTEKLGESQIRSKHDLTRFFGRTHGRAGSRNYVAAKDSVEYQPAKWLVRLVDTQYCEHVRARYGRSCEFFDYDLVIGVAQQILAQREAVEPPARHTVGAGSSTASIAAAWCARTAPSRCTVGIGVCDASQKRGTPAKGASDAFRWPSLFP